MVNAVAAVLTWALSVGAQAADGAPQDEKIDFPALVEMAKAYDFPLPPREAPLVLGDTMYTTLVGSSSTSHDPGLYTPAFLLEKLPNGHARVLFGWEEKVVRGDADHRPSSRPFSLDEPKPKLKGYVLRANNLETFVTAVQLAERGELERAKAIWALVKGSRYFHDINFHEGLGGLLSKPRVLFARAVYEHLYRAVLAEDCDLKGVYDQLVRLKAEYPTLFDENEYRFHADRKARFIRDLGLTLSTKKAPEGSVEALLFEWGSRPSRTEHLGVYHLRNKVVDEPARRIVEKGLEAVPELVRLSKDTRLTRRISPAIMKAPERRVRLGHLAQNLLGQIGGGQDLSAGLPEGVREAGEQAFFERNAVDRKGGAISRFHVVPLQVLGKKHPSALPKFAREVPEKTAANVNLFPLTRAIRASTLPREEKSSTLADLAERVRDHRGYLRTALQDLAAVDPEKCAALVRPALLRLPKDVKEPYWTSEAANYTHVIMLLPDVEIWKEYLKVARKAAVPLRMEMMNPMNYSYIGEKQRRLRLAFLAAFLEDDALRDSSVNPGRYKGPHAAFTFDTIEVRDFVAMKIASILGMNDRPTEFWTKDDWAAFRAKVRTALEKETLPNLGD